MSFFDSHLIHSIARKMELGKPWWLSSSPGGRGWGNRPDASFLNFHLFFLEVRKSPLSQTMHRAPSDVSRVLKPWKKGKTLFQGKYKQRSLLLFPCFQHQHHFLAQSVTPVIKIVFTTHLGFVISCKSCVAKESKRFTAKGFLFLTSLSTCRNRCFCA